MTLRTRVRCCTFRGSVLALDARTGSLLWKTYTVPPNRGPCRRRSTRRVRIQRRCCLGHAGGIAADPHRLRRHGQQLHRPRCSRAVRERRRSNLTAPTPAVRRRKTFDSVLALNLDTGALRWGHKVEGWDATTAHAPSTKPGFTWCPSAESPDFDFGGGGPNIFAANRRGSSAPVRRAASTGHSTRRRAKSCGTRSWAPEPRGAASSGERHMTVSASTPRLRTPESSACPTSSPAGNLIPGAHGPH